jgi:hypothetical protein
MPLAFQDLDPSLAPLNNDQAEILHSLQQDFVSEIGGAQQNPHDPRYAKKWQMLRPKYDEQLRLFFGAAFVEQVALRAAQADYAAAHPQ